MDVTIQIASIQISASVGQDTQRPMNRPVLQFVLRVVSMDTATVQGNVNVTKDIKWIPKIIANQFV